jgi:DNA-binding PadR family transcriptional regulator
MRRHIFYMLLSLAERDRHGSAIMRDVLALTDDQLTLWPAKLYGALDELCQEGWIRVMPGPPAGKEHSEGGHKKWFRITASGRRALAREVAALDGVVRTAQRRLAHSGETS